MLALTDEAWARIAIGATRVAPQHRSRWLKKVARELEGLSPNARRLRQYQRRRKNGQKCYRLTLDEVEVEQLLQAAGMLAGDPDHAAVERALERFLGVCHRNAFQPDAEICASVKTELALTALERALSDGGSSKRVRK
jgi:hypothetical protein